ncbi:hypothetical protein [Endozoicomonas sp.]|uniref:hypothetical protein n=1 Tax=Endozoicomonas sp. TaxID=1892382 RepID=UPI003AF832CC
MRLKQPFILLLTGMLSATGASLAAAQNLYKYRNHEGVTVISSNMPSEFVHLGYSILDRNGRIVETIPPVMTRDQKNQLEHLKSRKVQQEHEAELDQELLFLYGTPDEIYGAMNRKLDELDQKVREMHNLEVILAKNIDDKRLQIKKAGDKAPEYLHEELENLKDQKETYGDRAATYNREKSLLKKQYTASAERLRKLLRQKNLKDIEVVSREQLIGQWRIREDVAMDWNLDASGSFDSFFQQLGTHASEKSFGTWQLSNNRIILLINRKQQKDAIGDEESRRVSQEKQIQVLKATDSELQLLMDGKAINLFRS